MAVAVVGLVIVGFRLMNKVRVWFPVPNALVAEIVMLLVPDVVGFPEISPVAVFTLRPAGRLVAPKLIGVLLAVMV